MMTEPLMSADAEPEFETWPRYLKNNLSKRWFYLIGSGDLQAIPNGKMVKMASSKRSVKSKPPRQEQSTTGPKVSSTVIEQVVLESDMIEVMMANGLYAALSS